MTLQIFEEGGDNSLSFDDTYADFTVDVYPDSKTYQSNRQLKEDVYYSTEKFEYRIKTNTLKVEIRLIERVDSPPKKYCVKDGVVLESDILTDRKETDSVSFMTKEFIDDLREEVKWHESWIGDPVSMYILSKHPEIISFDDYRRYLRRFDEKIKVAIQKIEKFLQEDKSGLMIVDGEFRRAIWYPTEIYEKFDDKETEERAEERDKILKELFNEKSNTYVGISENEFIYSNKILECIQKLLEQNSSLTKKIEDTPVERQNGKNKTYTIFVYLASILLIFLKLTDNLNWNWLGVLAPVIIWEGFGFVVGFLRSMNK